jgi:hypothetical protein
MALFPMSGVLRGFSACDVPDVRLGGNPCAALLIKKIAHFQMETYQRYLLIQDYCSDKHSLCRLRQNLPI